MSNSIVIWRQFIMTLVVIFIQVLLFHIKLYWISGPMYIVSAFGCFLISFPHLLTCCMFFLGHNQTLFSWHCCLPAAYLFSEHLLAGHVVVFGETFCLLDIMCFLGVAACHLDFLFGGVFGFPGWPRPVLPEWMQELGDLTHHQHCASCMCFGSLFEHTPCFFASTCSCKFAMFHIPGSGTDLSFLVFMHLSWTQLHTWCTLVMSN